MPNSPTGQPRTVPQKQCAAVISHLLFRSFIWYWYILTCHVVILCDFLLFCVVLSQVLKQHETLDNEILKGCCYLSKWRDRVNSNFYFLLRSEPLHSMVCILSWWWAPYILWIDRWWTNSSEQCYFTSDENTFLIRICASQGLMRYSPLILIAMIALLIVYILKACLCNFMAIINST